MITARNYAAQAEKGLFYFSKFKNLSPGIGDIDREHALGMSEIIHDSVHFVLPDNGDILNDELKGLDKLFLNLPYPAITVEYFVPETNEKFVASATQDNIQSDIIIMGAFCSQQQNWHWIPEPYSIKIPRDIHVIGDKSTRTIECRILMPGIFEYFKCYDSDFDKLSYQRISFLALSVQELLEALSCTNIKTFTHQHASPANEKRIKAGKLPIYETKVLVIDTQAASSGKSSNMGGSHASPRQHLRRGHIRRLPNGNIWVNSCVVGDPAKGRINKQYSVH